MTNSSFPHLQHSSVHAPRIPLADDARAEARIARIHAEIVLPTGEVVLIDAEDVAVVEPFNWHRHQSHAKTYYVRAKDRRQGRENEKTIYLHRLILAAGKGQYVDHINHDGLDNRKVNLRIVTNAQNAARVGKRNPNASSRYCGVRWIPRLEKWGASIADNTWLGTFADEIEAARAYDEAAIERYGDCAFLNFPDMEAS
jgi:hypothetical protein